MSDKTIYGEPTSSAATPADTTCYPTISDWSPEDFVAEIATLRAENARLLAELEKATRANRTRASYDLRCQDCGRAHILDTVLPSETWNKIADPSDLLCMTCIDDRLQAKGLTAEAEFYFVGEALKSKLYDYHIEAERDALAARNAGLVEALRLAKRHLNAALLGINIIIADQPGRERAMLEVIAAAREVAMKYDDFSEPEIGAVPEYNEKRRALYDAIRALDTKEERDG